MMIIIIIIIINIKNWTLWSVPFPELQLLAPSLLRSSSCSLDVRSVMAAYTWEHDTATGPCCWDQKCNVICCLPSRNVVTCKYNVSVNNTTIYLCIINIVYCQGDMFRPLLGHLQALWENRFKTVHNALKHRQFLDLFSQKAWRWPNKGRNMSPWQYTMFILHK